MNRSSTPIIRPTTSSSKPTDFRPKTPSRPNLLKNTAYTVPEVIAAPPLHRGTFLNLSYKLS